MDVDNPRTRRMAEAVTPRQAVANSLHILQAHVILWSVMLTAMLVDDAAMLALVIC